MCPGCPERAHPSRTTVAGPGSQIRGFVHSVGVRYDNSMIESFWSRMQVELLDRQKWKTRVELANAMFDYLEIWHKRRRRHSQLGWLTPIEFERVNAITVA